VVLSDGLSDPSPDHGKIDLAGIAEMIPQELGWGLYLVGLPDDISGLFQSAPPDETGMVRAPANEHITGIPLKEFSREKLKKAVEVAQEDIGPTASLAEPAPEPATPSSDERASAFPVWWMVGAAVLALLGAAPLFRRRKADGGLQGFTLEIVEDGKEPQRFPVAFGEKGKKTAGARGDIPLVDGDLPPVVFTLSWTKGQLWLTPQDTITINGQITTGKTAVGIGDRIRVREKVQLTMEEGEIER
jgi:hypothetical protein